MWELSSLIDVIKDATGSPVEDCESILLACGDVEECIRLLKIYNESNIADLGIYITTVYQLGKAGINSGARGENLRRVLSEVIK